MLSNQKSHIACLDRQGGLIVNLKSKKVIWWTEIIWILFGSGLPAVLLW